MATALAAESQVMAPHPGPQERFLASPADLVFFGGEAGGGKTWGLLMEACRHVGNPGFRSVILRRTSPRITQEGGLWDTSYEIYPHLGAEPFQSPSHEWRFPSGARVAFHHLQHEKDRLEWKGAQIPLLCWDQVEEFTERQFWYLFSRNRSTCGVVPYIRATCNPVPPEDEPGGWVHLFLAWWIDQETGYPIPERDGVLRWFLRARDEIRWFDTPEEAIAWRDAEQLPEALEPKSATFIRSRLEDNPTLMRTDPGYGARLELLPKVDRDRLRGGNWLVRETAGEILNRAWFEIVDAAPAVARKVRYWDKAGTEGGGAYSAGDLMSEHEGTYYVEDVVLGQWSAFHRERVIRQTTENDGPAVEVWIEQEPGSGGKESAEITIRNLAGFVVHAERATGSKVDRAKPLAAQAEAGNVKLVRGPWNEEFLRQAQRFEEGVKRIDAIDAAAGAFNKLALKPEPKSYGARGLISVGS